MKPRTKFAILPHFSSLLINRNFGFLWIGQAISSLGDSIYFITLSLWIATVIAKNQPWAPIAVGGVTIAITLPMFFFGIFAGVFVDRWDKRMTMIRMDIIRAILILLLIPLTGLVSLPFVHEPFPISWQLASIYATVLLASICSYFFSPARFTILSEILPETQRAHASAMEQTSTSIVRILGPLLATPLFFVVGIQWVLLLNAISFAISFVAIFAVHVPKIEEEQQPEIEKTHFLDEVKEGLRFCLQNKVLLTLLISLLIVTLGAGGIDTLLIFFFEARLHAPIAFYGTLPMATGVGWVGGAIFASQLVKHWSAIRIFGLSLCGVGIMLILFSRQSTLGPALAFLCVLGSSLGALNTVIGPLLMRIIPKPIMGRVVSIFDTSQTFFHLVSVSLAGFLAALLIHLHFTLLGMSFETYDTIYTIVGFIFLLGASYTFANIGDLTVI